MFEDNVQSRQCYALQCLTQEVRVRELPIKIEELLQ